MTAPTERLLPLHAGINFSRLEVGGDLGGFVFALGSVLALVAGLPQVRWFVLMALAAAVPIAWLLLAWHRHHEGPPELWRPIDLELTGPPSRR